MRSAGRMLMDVEAIRVVARCFSGCGQIETGGLDIADTGQNIPFVLSWSEVLLVWRASWPDVK